MLRIVIFLILLLMASAYALWKGGGPERVMATILLGMLVVDQLVHLLIPAQFASVDTAHLALDLLAALLTFMLAMTAHRFWPMVAAVRSEERRVGKECVSVDLGGRRFIKKKKKQT